MDISGLSVCWRAARELDPDAPDESRRPGGREGHLDRLLEQAGLGPVRTGALTVRVRHEDFGHWWDRFTLGVGPSGAYVASLDEDCRVALRELCRRLLPAGPVEITATAWAVAGRA